MKIESSQCSYCVWYFGDKRCFGFRDGIPDEIFDGSVWHDEPYEGDNGYRFIQRGPEFGAYDTTCKSCGRNLRIPVWPTDDEELKMEMAIEIESKWLICPECRESYEQKQRQRGVSFDERITS